MAPGPQRMLQKLLLRLSDAFNFFHVSKLQKAINATRGVSRHAQWHFVGLLEEWVLLSSACKAPGTFAFWDGVTCISLALSGVSQPQSA